MSNSNSTSDNNNSSSSTSSTAHTHTETTTENSTGSQNSNSVGLISTLTGNLPLLLVRLSGLLNLRVGLITIGVLFILKVGTIVEGFPIINRAIQGTSILYLGWVFLDGARRKRFLGELLSFLPAKVNTPDSQPSDQVQAQAQAQAQAQQHAGEQQ